MLEMRSPCDRTASVRSPRWVGPGTSPRSPVNASACSASKLSRASVSSTAGAATRRSSVTRSPIRSRAASTRPFAAVSMAATSRSVVPPIADTTTTGRRDTRADTMSATRVSAAPVPNELPPNFMTIIVRPRESGALSHGGQQPAWRAGSDGRRPGDTDGRSVSDGPFLAKQVTAALPDHGECQ